jgi:predicted branched-subunit amino acid permease
LLGILLAAYIPTQWGLSFAGILALLGITLSLVQDRLTAVTAAVAALIAVVFVALPLKLNLLIAVVVGMTMAMGWQWMIEKQAARSAP